MLFRVFPTMLLLLIVPEGGLCIPTWLLVMVLESMYPPPLIPKREFLSIKLPVIVNDALPMMSIPSFPSKNELPLTVNMDAA